MRTSIIGLVLTLLAASLASADSAPPAAPRVTMGADLKLLRFDWEPVPGASFYRLWVRPGGSRYISAGERIPASTTHAQHAIPVHLQNWERLRYVVTACNSSGCAHSAALNPRSLMLQAIGYLKASNTGVLDLFGGSLALSDDGYTLAVSATNEASNTTGVNGDQADNSSQSSGAVYIFRRRGNTWHQEAYLKASINQLGQGFGDGVALSANGSLLAVGAPREDINDVSDVGALYIFQRIQNVWKLMTRLDNPQPKEFDGFGFSPQLSDDGLTLKVTSVLPLHWQGEFGPEFRTHTYVRAGNAWQHFQTLAPFYGSDLCPTTRLSGDGRTLVSSCSIGGDDAESAIGTRLVTMKRTVDTWVHASDLVTDFSGFSSHIAINGDATVVALPVRREPAFPDLLRIYRWVGGAWVRETEFSAPDISGAWASSLAFADNGRLLAIGDSQARENGAGVSPGHMPGEEQRGAVYLYQRNDTGAWSLRNVVKAPNPGLLDDFGATIALSASGRTLAVGAPLEDSNATGIDGERRNEDAPNSGAAYLY